MELIGEVEKVELRKENGYVPPVIVLKDGRVFIPRHTPTGSCWVTDLVVESPPAPLSTLK